MISDSIKHSQPWYTRKPLAALAPMEAITDRPYRKLVREIAPEIILYTEFVNASGLIYGGDNVWKMAEFDESERPLIIQIYDSDPGKLGIATRMVAEKLRPDGIDLNMGCPVRKVAGRGAGCGMMADIETAVQAVTSMIENAGDIPVSVKTRLGISRRDQVIELGHAMIEAGIKQLSIHARLKANRPRDPADWESLSKAARCFDVPVIGNGDIFNAEDASRMVSLEGVDGVMIGRGAIGNPWLLKRITQILDDKPVDSLPSREERAMIAIRHMRLNIADKGERRGVLEMRKVFRNYIKGYMDTKRFWMRLIEVETEIETTNILEEFSRGKENPVITEFA